MPGAILQEVKINSSLYALCNVLQLLLRDYGKGMAAVGMGVSYAENDWGWGFPGMQDAGCRMQDAETSGHSHAAYSRF